MVKSAREIYGLMRVGERTPKSVQWDDEVKAAVERAEAAQKQVQGTRDGVANKDISRFIRKKRKRLSERKGS